MVYFFFFFNDTATTEIYTLSLHDALPIFAIQAEKPSAILIDQRPLPSTRESERIRRIVGRSEEHTSELQSPCNLVCRLLLEKKKKNSQHHTRFSTINTVSALNSVISPSDH